MDNLLGQFLEAHRERMLVHPQAFEAGGDRFQLPSGILQDRFVSVWPLIENLVLFNQVTELLARELVTFCRAHSAQMIVGCTMTVRQLFEGMRTRPLDGLTLEYLGNYPLLPLRSERAARLRMKSAVIFTDVMSTGQLIADTCQFLRHHDVPVAGVLSLVRLNHGIADERVLTTTDSHLELHTLGGGGRAARVSVPFASYIRLPVSAARARTGVDTRPIHTDPVTVYPQLGLNEDPLQDAEIGFESELQHMAAGRELRVGYFSSGNDRFTLFVDIPCVLARHIDRIVDRISEKFTALSKKGYPAPILVTTPSKENREFLALVMQRLLAREMATQYVLFSKSDDFDGSCSYLLLGDGASVRGRPAVVLLATIQSTDTVRAVSALLSLHDSPDVTIVCAVNRTTPASASFLARILKLRRSQTTTQPPGHSEAVAEGHQFSVVSLLRLWDLSVSDLNRMEHLAHAQFRKFRERCRSPALASLSLTDLKYFQPEEVLEIVAAARGAVEDAPDENAQIARAAKQALLHRDPQPLIALIPNESLSKGGLFAVYRYLMVDTTSLGLFAHRTSLTDTFTRALQQTDAEIRRIEDECHGLSDEVLRHALLNAIGKERQLLIGVGLLAQFLVSTGGPATEDAPRPPGSLNSRVREILLGIGAEPDTLATLARLYDVEWCYAFVFAVQLLDVLSGPEDHELGILEALESIRHLVSIRARGQDAPLPALDSLARLAPPGTKHERESFVPLSLVMSVTALIDALGEEEHPIAGECVAAIRREIMWPRPSHSLSARILAHAPRSLREAFAETPETESAIDFRAAPQELQLVHALNRLILAASTLARLSGYARRLIELTFKTGHWVGYFRSNGPTSFAGQAKRLAEIAQLARNARTFSRIDLESLSSVCEDLLREVWGRNRPGGLPTEARSPFFDFVAAFECDVRRLLMQAVELARHRIESESGAAVAAACFGGNWSESRADEEGIFVLCDRQLLLMAFENYASNFRYSSVFGNLADVGTDPASIGSIELQVDEDDVAIVFRSSGERVEQGQYGTLTMNDHHQRLEDFDCRPTYQNEAGSYVVKLTFARIRPRAGLPSMEESLS